LLYVLHGEDDFSIRQALVRIKKKMGDEAALATNTAVLDGRRVTLEQLRQACDTVPFLAEGRLVIIEGLLERFEAGGKPRGRKARTGAPDSEVDSFAGYFNQVPAFTTVVLTDGKVSERNPLLQRLSTAGVDIRAFPLMKDTRRLGKWIEERVASQGGSISWQAAGLLAEFIGPNLWVMASEIDKLLLYTSGNRIEEDDIRAVVSYVQEANAFALVDAVMEFRTGAAQELLLRLMQQGINPSGILALIYRKVRLLTRIKGMSGEGLSRNEIQSRLGIPHDFVVSKALEQASKYSLARLGEVYHSLLEADLSIKTGRYDGELALSILVAELGQRQKTGVV
jgi:DNA polymerase-3 subunit delta